VGLKEEEEWSKLRFELYIYELDLWGEQTSGLAISCLDGPESCLVGPLFRVMFVLALRVEIAALDMARHRVVPTLTLQP
jgi:hypothetical protein